MKKIILKIVILCVSLPLYLHALGQHEALTIGDECPDVLLKKVVNYQTSTIRISDFRGKLLILDFWATWCAPCISMMQTADSLQKKYEGKIQILPVTMEDSKIVSEFLENIRRSKHINPPSVTNDTILNLLFPHKIIPHYVWLDETGKVIGVTGGSALTAVTIDRYLHDKVINGGEMESENKIIDYTKPFFAVGNNIKEEGNDHFVAIDNSDLLYHSVLTNYIDGFPCESGADSTRIVCENYSVGDLYRVVAGRGKVQSLFLNSTLWRVTNPRVQEYTDSTALSMEKKHYEESLKWMKTHSFCYELKFPPELNSTKYDIALEDLNRYFGAMFNIEGGIEKITTKCLALIRTDSREKFASQEADSPVEFNQYHLKITDRPMSVLVTYLSFNFDLLPPIIDETGYKGKVDLELNCNLANMDEVQKALSNYGLQLVEKERELEMIVIKDKPRGQVNVVAP